ncbi:arylsulfotransferase family protein [Streptomyces phaeochromogenes]
MIRLPQRWTAVALSGLVLVTMGSVAPEKSPTPVSATASGSRAASGPSGAPSAAVRAAAAATDAQPDKLKVVTSRPGLADGLLFVTPQTWNDKPRGPQIVDNKGRQVWFHRIPDNEFATNFRVQTYQGRKVLTWWQGTTTNTGIGDGVGYIADEHYNIIATVRVPASDGTLGFHEFALTPRGTALVIVHKIVPFDFTPFGGPADGRAVDDVVTEIDVATGDKVAAWNSMDHVLAGETDFLPKNFTDPYDYLHVNSVSVDTDGNWLVSGRYTSTVYKVDRKTGKIIWRLGGRTSDFRLGTGARFMWQHSVEPEGNGVYRVFDNATYPPFVGYESRVAYIKADTEKHTATLVRQLTHPESESAPLEGGSQALPNGDVLVSWGTGARVTEFSPTGDVLFDATLPGVVSSYRAYRMEWKGRPDTGPEATVADGAVHAVWNGATGVQRWRVLAGGTRESLARVTDARWNGYDTAVPLPESARDSTYVQVQAVDAHGKVIGSSPVTATG